MSWARTEARLNIPKGNIAHGLAYTGTKPPYHVCPARPLLYFIVSTSASATSGSAPLTHSRICRRGTDVIKEQPSKAHSPRLVRLVGSSTDVIEEQPKKA
jgi:hypothetical protein